MVLPLATSATAVDETQGDLNFCHQMACHVNKATDLPAICRKFPSIFEDVRRKSVDEKMDIAFQGMPSGSAIQARRSRVLGYEHHAKLQRRMTSAGHNHHYQPQPVSN